MTPSQTVDDLSAAIASLQKRRKRPLLILYYAPDSRSQMRQVDAAVTYRVLREQGLSKEAPIEKLDVIIETYGGDPTAAYAMAQTVSRFARDIAVVVAEHAFSAGTLFSFVGTSINMADGSALSPIDITLESEERPQDAVELATLDAFMEFTIDARRRVERVLADYPTKVSTADSDALVQMIRDVGALKVGKYYRERQLTGQYANLLLSRRLLKDDAMLVTHVVDSFLFGAPAHAFHMDVDLCRRSRLPVTEMSTDHSDAAKGVVQTLHSLAGKGEVCDTYQRGKRRKPFIAYFGYTETNGSFKSEKSQRVQRGKGHKTSKRVLPVAPSRNGLSRRPVPA